MYLPATLGLISEQIHGLPNSCDILSPRLNSDLIANHLTWVVLCHGCPAVNCVLCGMMGLHSIDLTSAFGSKKFQVILLFWFFHPSIVQQEFIWHLVDKQPFCWSLNLHM